MSSIVMIDPLDLVKSRFNKQYIEESTWQGANSIAEELDIEVGSDDFVEVYEDLKDSITWANNFSAQVIHTTLQALRMLLVSGDLVLGVAEDETPNVSIETVAETFTTATLLAIATIKAGPNRGMMTNKEIKSVAKSDRVVTFIFDDDVIDNTTSETGDNQ